MNRLALRDEILLQIDKPARYIGNEINAIVKNKEEIEVRFALCFPDVYEIGMSHLGIQILYDMFNQRQDVWCERVYSPWPDLHAIMKEQHIPLFALESQDAIKDFDFLGITIQYEMCYTNILQILDLSQIPLLSADRTWEHPIVIGGGPCTYNPEPIADFFDLFYIGEGETSYAQLLNTYLEYRKNGSTRNEFLQAAANIPGIYAPIFYEVSYKEDGTISSFQRNTNNVPEQIHKEIVMDISDTFYPMKPILPFIKATQDRVVLEIQRGCIRGCRFCQAGMVYRPVRERSLETLKKYANEMLKNTGHEEISLSSLSSSDYSQLNELVQYLVENVSSKGINISLPSLRIDAFSLEVMSKIQDVRKSSLTFAPEAGSQRLRNVINKGLTEDTILNGAELAFRGGWNKVKLYFMLGLPTETEEDMRGIAELSDQIARLYYEVIPKEERSGKVQITASTSFFIPKPFTPFQWAKMYTAQEFVEKAHFVNDAMKEQLNKKSIKYNWHEPDVSELEGVFARGDRRVGQVIKRAYEKGCIFDAWSEHFSYRKWSEAFQECDIAIAFYNNRERSLEEILPWDFIDAGITKKFLKQEWEQAIKEEITPNCRSKCSSCGANRYGGGVCYENKN